MSSRTRSRLLRLAVVAMVVLVVRELSLRRHHDDLHDWPGPHPVPDRSVG
ncbi:MAG: hypothetical protein R2695_19435 [Acidimicrobiales bacterium]